MECFVLDSRDMPSPVPPHFQATLHGTSASRAGVDAPCEVDASWAPEHLLLSSVGLCVVKTFETFAARDGIELVAWSATVQGSVAHAADGPSFSSIVMCLDLELDAKADGLERTLEEARQACLVTNSLRVPVVIETTIRTPADRAQRQAG